MVHRKWQHRCCSRRVDIDLRWIDLEFTEWDSNGDFATRIDHRTLESILQHIESSFAQPSDHSSTRTGRFRCRSRRRRWRRGDRSSSRSRSMFSRRRRETFVVHRSTDRGCRWHLVEELAVTRNIEIQTNQRSGTEESREDLCHEHKSTRSDTTRCQCIVIIIFVELVSSSHRSIDERTERNLSIRFVQERRLYHRTSRWESLRMECQGKYLSAGWVWNHSSSSSSSLSCITWILTVYFTKIWKRWKTPRRTLINSIISFWTCPSTITTRSLLHS